MLTVWSGCKFTAAGGFDSFNKKVEARVVPAVVMRAA